MNLIKTKAGSVGVIGWEPKGANNFWLGSYQGEKLFAMGGDSVPKTPPSLSHVHFPDLSNHHDGLLMGSSVFILWVTFCRESMPRRRGNLSMAGMDHKIRVWHYNVLYLRSDNSPGNFGHVF